MRHTLSIVLLLFSVAVEASSTRTTIASASIPIRWRRQMRCQPAIEGVSSRRRRSPLFSAGWKNSRRATAYGGDVLLATRRTNEPSQTTRKAKSEERTTKSKNDAQSSDVLTYKDLPLAGKIVAGFVEIAIVTAIDYVSGFLGAYSLGSLVGLPGLVLGDRNAVATTFMQGASHRLGRMHHRSIRWAKAWGGVSAAVGGISVAARVVRGGKEDEWTPVLSSMAMGAYFFRSEGPVGMVKGALLFGTIVKLFSVGGKMKQELPPEIEEDETLILD